MVRYNDLSRNGFLAGGRAATMMLMMMALLGSFLSMADAFTLQPHPSLLKGSTPSSTTSLSALNKRGKFNKQKDLAAKMADAKKKRELEETGSSPEDAQAAIDAAAEAEGKKELSAKEIKERNDRKRFADLLENSITGGGGDLEKGYYLTEAQEEENADAVFKGIVRLYEGDPAPTTPFAELLNIENGEPIGKGGTKRIVPWEGSSNSGSSDYMVIVTDPRPKSSELRTAMKRLAGAVTGDVLKKCVVINTDSPGENRRFLKKNLEGESLRVLVDENMEWMREYTALGETRFSMTMFILRKGRVEKIVREVEAEVLPMVVKNAIKALS